MLDNARFLFSKEGATSQRKMAVTTQRSVCLVCSGKLLYHRARNTPLVNGGLLKLMRRIAGGES
jgi:hypothetical protein